MQVGPQVTSSSSFQIPAQPEPAVAFRSGPPILLDSIPPLLARGIINPKRGMEEPPQPPPPPSPAGTCSSPGMKSCWNLDVRVALILVTLAGALILFLLYRLLRLRHRLRLARARHALEYNSFYHSATYRLKDVARLPQELSVKNGTVTEVTLPIQTVTAVTPTATITPLLPPPPPVSLPPPLLLHPPPALLPPPPRPPPPPSVPATPPLLVLPLIHTTPPSPHLSWGACSDADVYSRIGAFRPSRLSSLSSQSTVILFEHSSV
ncbi:uncharacterized protein LOC142987957 [Genypterus blacodes]|uniref:uncharacterized protein LOC142987957 n=1 Tax=Genypterus blacodes TaxID=154954 RepID=UPI003F75C325